MSKEKKAYKKAMISGKTRRNWMYGYLFISPWLVGVFVFVFYSILNAFNFSLNTIRITPRGILLTSVGLKNYADIFVKDMFFVQRLLNFGLDVLLQMPIIVSFALMMSLLINGKIKFKGLFRTIFFLPVIIATGPVMNELTRQGVASVPMVNQSFIVTVIGTILPEFIVEPITTLFSSLILILWSTGVQILIFLAGLQKVDPAQYEAAKIDGASAWECFWKITLPVMRPLVLLNTMYTIVAMATSGNNDVVALIYTNMFSSDRGYGFASAMAFMYTIVILLILGLFFLILRQRKDEIVPVEKRLQRGARDGR